MCVYSMVMDHYHDKWNQPPYKFPQLPEPMVRPIEPPALPKPITADEIDEFRRLLERARKYDVETGQRDCETDEKRKRLLDLAKELGVEISFV